MYKLRLKKECFTGYNDPTYELDVAVCCDLKVNDRIWDERTKAYYVVVDIERI